MQKTIFFFGFLLSYINIINYSFPLGIIFLFSTIFLNFIVYFLYKKFFYKLQEHFQIEKELLFYQYLKSKEETLKNKYSKSNPCIICFDDFTTLDICELNCSCINKFYHEKCLKSWIEKKSSCPICRKYIE
jgi:hypothetical protein